jgi:hypothetical protein
MKHTPKIVHVFKFLLMGIAFVVVIGFSVQFLWNWLIPELFHGPLITFWQALGLCLLGKLVLGWHGHGGGGGPFGARAKQQWRKKLKDRMENMSDEEKTSLRERLRHCSGRYNRWHEDFNTDEPNSPKQETNL